MSSSVIECDVAIAGGGLVGASLALALAQIELSVVLIEAVAPGEVGQPSFDDRTSALSNGSQRVFEALGVWSSLARDATPIRRIHISDQGRFGFARLSAEEQGIDALGYVVTNRVMGQALWERLSRTNVRVLAPARVVSTSVEERERRVVCRDGNDQEIEIRARLAVAADGARSVLRESAGIGARTWDYEQVALVTNVFTQRFHDYVAYERFTPTGPMALLPMSEGRVGFIWTLAPQAAHAVADLPEVAFLARAQQEFGFRLGRLTRVGSRQLYPLSLTRSDRHIAPRLAVVGNAAQALHPIAGQGFNLGLRDAVSLAEILADARTGAASPDPGNGLLLERYRAWRTDDRQRIVRFTDGLVRLFRQPFAPIKFARDVGLLAFDLLPFAKDALAQLSLGAAGRVPRLARGGTLERA
jgi:2-octaprenyl-6-methoxyphenol hydroxylase